MGRKYEGADFPSWKLSRRDSLHALGATLGAGALGSLANRTTASETSDSSLSTNGSRYFPSFASADSHTCLDGHERSTDFVVHEPGTIPGNNVGVRVARQLDHIGMSIPDENDSIGGTCGNFGSKVPVQNHFRLVSVGYATNGYEVDALDEQVGPGYPALKSMKTRVDLTDSDNSCGNAALSPNYMWEVASTNLGDFIDESSDPLPSDPDEFASQVKEEFQSNDQTNGLPLTWKDFKTALGLVSGTTGAADNLNLIEGTSKFTGLMGKAGKFLAILTIKNTLQEFVDGDKWTYKNSNDDAMELFARNKNDWEVVIHLANFTITSALNEQTTFRVSHEYDFDEYVSRINEETPPPEAGADPNGHLRDADYEIVVPGNDGDLPLSFPRTRNVTLPRPEANISISDRSPTPGETVTFDASDSVGVGTRDLEDFQWQIMKRESNDTDPVVQHGESFEWSFESVDRNDLSETFYGTGAYDVVLTVRNEAGFRDVATTSIYVTGDDQYDAPTGEVTITERNRIEDGERILFEASGSPGTADELADQPFEWAFSRVDGGDGGLQEPTDTGPGSLKTFPGSGTWEVTLQVTDQNDFTETIRERFTVQAVGAAPVASGDIDPNPIYGTGRQVTFDASSSRPANDEIESYEWRIDAPFFEKDLVLTGEQTTYRFADTGAISVELKVTETVDGETISDRTTLIADVRQERPLQADFTLPPVVETGEPVELDASPSTGRPNTFKWDTTDDGEFELFRETTGVRFDSPGTKTIRLHVEDIDGNESETTRTVEVTGSASVNAEVGTVSVNQAEPDGWKTVSLEKTYDDPVVVAGPLTYRGPQPAHARVKNVTGDSFDVQIEEWLYLDGTHATEEVAYMVVESGTHLLPDGRAIQAGTVGRRENWEYASFPESFESTPTVLTQVVGHNGGHSVTTRVRNVNADGFGVQLEEEEAQGPHITEPVAYVAIAPGTGTLGSNDYDVSRTDVVVDDSWKTIRYAKNLESKPVLIADMQTTNGPNCANLRQRDRSSTSVDLRVQEESSADFETNHAFEAVGYAAFEQAGVLGDENASTDN